MIEELLLWLWLFLRVSGFVQQSRQLGPGKTGWFVAFATLNFATNHPVLPVRLRRALALIGIRIFFYPKQNSVDQATCLTLTDKRYIIRV
jgi:hypothetical protein